MLSLMPLSNLTVRQLKVEQDLSVCCSNVKAQITNAFRESERMLCFHVYLSV